MVNATEALLDNVDDKSAYTVVMWANTSVGRGKSSAPITVDRKYWFNQQDMGGQIRKYLYLHEWSYYTQV